MTPMPDVFGGGGGENVPEVRAGILRDMQWAGVPVDEERALAVEAQTAMKRLVASGS